ncbi:MAG TPA: TRAP transporter small permease, partial [Deltaproteobacteria bacterium]|nr:TRAP transporter small permease [Deltaproteobacteria bacterium]
MARHQPRSDPSAARIEPLLEGADRRDGRTRRRNAGRETRSPDQDRSARSRSEVRFVGASDPRARILDLLHWIEDGFLALLLGILVVLAPLQIILRNAFDAGLSWADAFLRVLVLWIALFGALAASRGNKQIAIDVVSKLLSPRPRALLEFVTGLFTAFVCFVVARYAWAFVMAEREFGAKAFGDVPAWICESAIPFA